MATTINELARKALDLPTELRAKLADLLVESLDGAALGSIDRSWSAEAKRRRDEIRDGQADGIAGPDALRQVRDAIKR